MRNGPIEASIVITGTDRVDRVPSPPATSLSRRDIIPRSSDVSKLLKDGEMGVKGVRLDLLDHGAFAPQTSSMCELSAVMDQAVSESEWTMSMPAMRKASLSLSGHTSPRTNPRRPDDVLSVGIPRVLREDDLLEGQEVSWSDDARVDRVTSKEGSVEPGSVPCSGCELKKSGTDVPETQALTFSTTKSATRSVHCEAIEPDESRRVHEMSWRHPEDSLSAGKVPEGRGVDEYVLKCSIGWNRNTPSTKTIPIFATRVTVGRSINCGLSGLQAMSGFNRMTYWNQVRIEESCESISTARIDDINPFQLRYSSEVRSRVPRARECQEVEAEGD